MQINTKNKLFGAHDYFGVSIILKFEIISRLFSVTSTYLALSLSLAVNLEMFTI